MHGLLLPFLSRDVNEIALEYPVTTEIKLTDPRYNEVLSEFYENCCNRLKEYLEMVKMSLFYAKVIRFSMVPLCTCIPGLPILREYSGSGYNRYVRAWTATGQPITWGDDVLTVLMGTMPRKNLFSK